MTLFRSASAVVLSTLLAAGNALAQDAASQPAADASPQSQPAAPASPAAGTTVEGAGASSPLSAENLLPALTEPAPAQRFPTILTGLGGMLGVGGAINLAVGVGLAGLLVVSTVLYPTALSGESDLIGPTGLPASATAPLLLGPVVLGVLTLGTVAVVGAVALVVVDFVLHPAKPAFPSFL